METNAKMFDGYADKYDQWFLTNNRVFESELKLLHACLNPLKKDKILSVGCGSGLFESALKREYDIIVEYGLEPSTDMAKIAENLEEVLDCLEELFFENNIKKIKCSMTKNYLPHASYNICKDIMGILELNKI